MLLIPSYLLKFLKNIKLIIDRNILIVIYAIYDSYYKIGICFLLVEYIYIAKITKIILKKRMS